MDTSVLIVQAFLFLTMLVATGVQQWSRIRDRKWDLQDRAEARQELQERLQAEAVSRAASMARLETELTQNTKLSEQAFREANSVNEKIVHMGVVFDGIRRRNHIQLLSEINDIKKATELIAGQSARDECYVKVRNCIMSSMRKFYTQYPERADEDSMKAVVEMLTCLVSALDGYEITKKPLIPEATA